MKGNSANEAITLAMRGRWDEAAAANQRIIELFPNDIDAHNRLGKALTELRRYSEARDAYRRVLEIEPKNAIAIRNLERLPYLEEGLELPRESPSVNSRFFIEETSKARTVSLHNVARKEIIAKICAGERVYLQAKGPRLMVSDGSGARLGDVDSATGLRLIRLMEGGNQYQAAIASLRDRQVRIVIRETFRHPSQEGRSSFPPRPVDELRPYFRDSLVRHEMDEDEPVRDAEISADWEEDTEYPAESLSSEDSPAHPSRADDAGDGET